MSSNSSDLIFPLLLGACLLNLALPALAAEPVACDLMTHGDVESAFHAKFAQSAIVKSMPLLCSYQGGNGTVTLSIAKTTPASFANFAASRPTTPVAGVGEKAFLTSPLQLEVYEKGYGLQLNVVLSSFPAAQVTSALEALGKFAVARM